MITLAILLNQLITLYIWVIVLGVVLSWLIGFRIANPQHRLVYLTGSFLAALTEPVYERIRRVVPPIGMLDISPLILILLLQLARFGMWEFVAMVTR